ncbi:hypothetical protein ACJX0J_007968, partial [Zea mays]
STTNYFPISKVTQKQENLERHIFPCGTPTSISLIFAGIIHIMFQFLWLEVWCLALMHPELDGVVDAAMQERAVIERFDQNSSDLFVFLLLPNEQVPFLDK